MAQAIKSFIQRPENFLCATSNPLFLGKSDMGKEEWEKNRRIIKKTPHEVPSEEVNNPKSVQ